MNITKSKRKPEHKYNSLKTSECILMKFPKKFGQRHKEQVLYIDDGEDHHENPESFKRLFH